MDIYGLPAHGTLFNQMAATYPATHGDSGAPILNYWGSELLPGLAFVRVHGVHWGQVEINGQRYSMFSPQSGVYKDLHAIYL